MILRIIENGSFTEIEIGEVFLLTVKLKKMCLINIMEWLCPGCGPVDLTVCGGTKSTGSKRRSSCMSNWTKYYSDVRILDESASGLFSKTESNLLELL